MKEYGWIFIIVCGIILYFIHNYICEKDKLKCEREIIKKYNNGG